MQLFSCYPPSPNSGTRPLRQSPFQLPPQALGTEKRNEPNCQLCSLSAKPPATGASAVHTFPTWCCPGRLRKPTHCVTWALAGRPQGARTDLRRFQGQGRTAFPFLPAHCGEPSKQEPSIVQTTPTPPATLVKQDLKPLAPLVSRSQSQD